MAENNARGNAMIHPLRCTESDDDEDKPPSLPSPLMSDEDEQDTDPRPSAQRNVGVAASDGSSSSSLRSLRCDEHSGRDAATFCRPCSKYLCIECTIGEHNDHKKKTLEQAAQEENQQKQQVDLMRQLNAAWTLQDEVVRKTKEGKEELAGDKSVAVDRLRKEFDAKVDAMNKEFEKKESDFAAECTLQEDKAGKKVQSLKKAIEDLNGTLETHPQHMMSVKRGAVCGSYSTTVLKSRFNVTTSDDGAADTLSFTGPVDRLLKAREYLRSGVIQERVVGQGMPDSFDGKSFGGSSVGSDRTVTDQEQTTKARAGNILSPGAESDEAWHVPKGHPDQADANTTPNSAHFARSLSTSDAIQRRDRAVRPVSTPGGPPLSQHRATPTPAQQAAAHDTSTSGPDKINVYQRGTHTIKVYEFDITKAQVDAVVSPMGKTFADRNQVSEALYTCLGHGYKRTMDAYVKDRRILKKAECVSMESFNRGALFKHVLHVRGPDDSLTGDKLFGSKKESLRDAVKSVLNEVERNRTIISVAFPAIGTGNANMHWDRAVWAIVTSVLNFRFRKDVEVHLVGHDREMFYLFKSSMHEFTKDGFWKTWTEDGYPGSSRS